MGSMARVNVAAVPIPGVGADAGQVVENVMALSPEPASNEKSDIAVSDMAVPVATVPMAPEPRRWDSWGTSRASG